MKITAIVLAILGAALIGGGAASSGSNSNWAIPVLMGCVPAGIGVVLAVVGDIRESRKP